MSVYKSLTTSDVVVTPFKVNKSFSFQGASALTSSNIGIDRFRGKNTPYISGSDLTGQIISQSQALVYDSIKQLYYTNYLRGEDGSSILTSSIGIDGVLTGQNGIQPSYENYLPNTLLADRFFPTGSGDFIGVMSIPSNLFGEYIKPGTFSYINTVATYIDNGEGGLISGSTKVGDIIYEHGMVIMTNDEISEFVDDSNITCSFQSTMTIYESQYKCTFNPNEFVYSTNPSIISSSNDNKDGKLYDFATGSYFEPYITTIGLYSNTNELVAVGKLAQPLQSSNVTDTTILVNLDL